MREEMIVLITILLALSSMMGSGLVQGSESRAGDWSEAVNLSDDYNLFGSTYGENIIAYGRGTLKVSTDSGDTWSNTYNSEEARYCLGPSNIHRVTMLGVNNPAFYYSRSSDNGTTWTKKVEVFQITGENDGMYSIQYIEGTILIYSYEYQSRYDISILLSRSTDNGLKWSLPVTVDSGLYMIDPLPNDIVMNGKNLYMSYYHINSFDEELDSDIYVIESNDMGSTWTNRTLVATRGVEPRIVSESGKLHLTYFSYPNDVGIKITYSNDGWTWSDPVMIGNIEETDDLVLYHTLAVRRNHIFAGYHYINSSLTPAITCKINISMDGGTTWKDAGDVTDIIANTAIPLLQITWGKVHLLWLEMDEEFGGSSYYTSWTFDDSLEMMDSDGDGWRNNEDVYPFNYREWKDSDRDGIGDNSDEFPEDPNRWMFKDSDGDGIDDSMDSFPGDISASVDSDMDGYPDIWNPGKSESDSTTGLKLDEFPEDPFEWSDLDDDGVGDNSDKFPEDPEEWKDTDRDGIGDNRDAFPEDPSSSVDTDEDGYPDEWNDGKTEMDSTTGLRIDDFPEDPAAANDSDGDGYPDEWLPKKKESDSTTGLILDKFPDDPKEWNDTDLDGVGDNSDLFPSDPADWKDSDVDGFGDNTDAFPYDPEEWNDTDGDGFGDNTDSFVDDPREWSDTDGDGIGDNSDIFPDDPEEWGDSDDDGVGDNSDAFPENPEECKDTDGDGVGDNSDDFPDDPASSVDTDEDGYPDEWNEGKTASDSTSDLRIDAYPEDPEKWKKKEESNSILLFIIPVIVLILIIAAIMSFIFFRKKNDGKDEGDENEGDPNGSGSG